MDTDMRVSSKHKMLSNGTFEKDVHLHNVINCIPIRPTRVDPSFVLKANTAHTHKATNEESTQIVTRSAQPKDAIRSTQPAWLNLVQLFKCLKSAENGENECKLAPKRIGNHCNTTRRSSPGQIHPWMSVDVSCSSPHSERQPCVKRQMERLRWLWSEPKGYKRAGFSLMIQLQTAPSPIPRSGIQSCLQ